MRKLRGTSPPYQLAESVSIVRSDTCTLRHFDRFCLTIPVNLNILSACLESLLRLQIVAAAETLGAVGIKL